MEKLKVEKRASTLINMILGLGLVALIASTLLGAVYTITKEPIELAKAEKLRQAIQIVSPEFNNDPGSEIYKIPIEGNDSLICYPIRMDGKLIATAIKSYTDNGFSGRFYVLIGFGLDGRIINTSLLEHAETPGLGDKMDKKKSDWPDQFLNKDPDEFELKVTKDGGDVDAITAATISSRAYCEAVELSWILYMKHGKHE